MSATGYSRTVGEAIGRYRLVAPLGRGGFSEVWRARAADGSLVALKLILHPEHVAQLRAEADAVALVRGEGVVRVLEADLAHDPPFLALDVLEGGSLRERLTEERRYNLLASIVVFEGLLVTLARVHKAGVVHGDLKPENVLFRAAKSDAPWLCDFGLSRRIAQKTASLSVSLSLDDARLAGTLDYMAPEQRAGEKPSPRSDVFALGVILYELLAGVRPQGVFAMPSVLNPSLPPVIDRLVACSLASEPAHRFASAGAMLAFLRSGVGREWRELSLAHERLRWMGAADPETGVFAEKGVRSGLRIVLGTALLIFGVWGELGSLDGIVRFGGGALAGYVATRLLTAALRPWLRARAAHVVELRAKLLQQIQTGKILSTTLGKAAEPPAQPNDLARGVVIALAVVLLLAVAFFSGSKHATTAPARPENAVPAPAAPANEPNPGTTVRRRWTRQVNDVAHLSHLVLSPDGARLLTQDGEGFRVFETNNSGTRGIPSPTVGASGPLAFFPDGTRFVEGASSPLVRLWSLASGQLEGTYLLATPPTCLAVAPDSATLIAGGWKSAEIVDLTSKPRRQGTVLATKGDFVVAAWFLGDGKRAATATGSGFLQLWDVASGRELEVQRVQQSWKHGGPLFAPTPDGQRVLVKAEDALVLYDLSSGIAVVRSLGAGIAPAQGALNNMVLAVSADSRRALVAADHLIRLIDLETDAVLLRIPISIRDNATVLTFSPGGDAFYCATGHGAIERYEIPSAPSTK